ncbi:hypothetical protein C4K88_00100 [Arthrobacter pityocampae]|uniref:Uncharacterized protein n=1 Tax=Arthrobacter pityocampae TaxID=547334 RepID=A0A2S5J0N8_9MICC|nr:hypothetical protein [Arthrobacter pityocampae]PPB50364.1 hypothetical protein C4K88_00100 [Arthrobacter pityocampae]
MITHPGEYHDADSKTPVPQSRRTLELIERGRLMPPLPIQIALRERRPAPVLTLPSPLLVIDVEAA